MLTKLFAKADALVSSNKLASSFASFVTSKKGVTAIEYAIIGVAIAGTVAVVFGSSGGFKDALDQAMSSLKTAVTTGTSSGGTDGT